MVRSRLEILQWVVDAVVLVLSLALSYVIRIQVNIGAEGAAQVFVVPSALYLVVLAVWFLIFIDGDVYVHRYGTKFRHRLLNMVKCHFIACFLYFGVLYLFFRDFSRLQSAYFVGLALVGMVGSRIVLRLIRIFFYEKDEARIGVLIVGTSVNAAHLKEKIRNNPRMNLHVAGFIRLPFEDEIAPEVAQDIVGGVTDIIPLIEQANIGEVVIVPRWYSSEVSEEISRIVYQLQRFPVNVRLAPDYSEISFFQTVTESFGGLPVIGLRTPIFSPMQRLLKRTLDLAIAVPALIIGSPIFGLVALAIRLDSEGPVILRQERTGIHGNPFIMYKFRSMYHHYSHEDFDETQVNVIKRPDDPRITRVGKILRRTSLDELPQFINVIRGEMSLVGPRPELPALVKSYEWWQFKRFEVPQGMTGWWQVHGRADRPMHLHTEDDLYYIQNYSLWLDIQILLRTVRIVFTGTGAF